MGSSSTSRSIPSVGCLLVFGLCSEFFRRPVRSTHGGAPVASALTPAPVSVPKIFKGLGSNKDQRITVKVKCPANLGPAIFDHLQGVAVTDDLLFVTSSVGGGHVAVGSVRANHVFLTGCIAAPHDLNHPGGIQTSGNIVAVPFFHKDDESRGEIRFYDNVLCPIGTPVQVCGQPLCVGFAKSTSDSSYWLAIVRRHSDNRHDIAFELWPKVG